MTKSIILNNGMTSIIDDDDYKNISKFNWGYSKSSGYAERRITKEKYNSRIIRLHQVILPVQRGTVVDHINGNKLDNRRINLRACSIADNIRHRVNINKNNTSGYPGIRKQGNKWVARIKHNRREIHIGCFNTPDEAYSARLKVSSEINGEFIGI